MDKVKEWIKWRLMMGVGNESEHTGSVDGLSKPDGVLAADVVTVYDNGTPIGTAPVVNGAWHYDLLRTHLGRHTFTAKVEALESRPWAIEIANPAFRDFTDFAGQNWNGWSRGPAGSTIFWRDGYVLNDTYSGGIHAGIVLKKTVSGLFVGTRYRFSIRSRQGAAGSRARLSLSTSVGAVTGEFIPATQWGPHGGEFTATQSVMELRINSHQSDFVGNDYSIDDILIVNVV